MDYSKYTKTNTNTNTNTQTKAILDANSYTNVKSDNHSLTDIN